MRESVCDKEVDLIKNCVVSIAIEEEIKVRDEHRPVSLLFDKVIVSTMSNGKSKKKKKRIFVI